jgi:hypothetical protein
LVHHSRLAMAAVEQEGLGVEPKGAEEEGLVDGVVEA